ncbi:P-loop NTPase fold protein [uncultured Chryseobacterium sp.]|uniref:KAP family P-loop NTPase fold protein n=1 Tax=uncultured Chryseobacterium sp. TaxID=259322 RepID=UPI0025F14124|nr:P-loop NTPase fold protein [uncultured Chryseobacterium sp.]
MRLLKDILARGFRLSYKKMTEFLKDNRKIFIIFILTLVISFFSIEYINKLILEIGKTIDCQKSSFKIGYWILFLCIFIFYINLILKRYIHKKNITFLIYYISIIYISLRFVNIIQDDLKQDFKISFEKQDEIKFLYEYNIRYADIILIVAILHTLNLLYVLKKRFGLEYRNDELNFFIEDKLFSNQTIDNEKILLQLIENISGFKPEQSFSIGLNAVWGYGKSSFLHRFKLLYSEQYPKSIIFWYRIWKNKGSNAIIENFFEELKENLKPYSAEISNDIDKYVDSILSLSSSDLKKLSDFGKSFFNENETLESFYLNINNIIKTIDRQIVILLDDLDRLEKEEIMNTLKLIRTLSDFNNIIFISGYDRKYIIETIDVKKNNYLDKIFNVEINLLPFNSELIVNELLDLINSSFPKNESNEDEIDMYVVFKNLFDSNSDVQNSILSLEDIIDSYENKNSYKPNHQLSYQDFFETYRDVKRFVNEFKFNFSFINIRSNIVISEYILLKLLTYKFRDLQYAIFSDLNKILDKGIIDNVNRDIKILGADLSNDIYIYSFKVKESLKENLLKDYRDKDFNIIDAVFYRLFGKKSIEYYEKNQNSISKIFYTDIYIKNDIAGNIINISDMHTAHFENKLFDLAEGIDIKENKNLFSIANEIKQFIYNNRLNSKDQFLDSLKTLNYIIINSNYHDDKETVRILLDAFKFIYNGNKDVFNKDVFNIIKTESIGYLDLLFSDINVNLVRKKYSDDHNNSRYTNEISNVIDVEHLLIRKLEYLIESKSSPISVFNYYTKNTKYLVLDKRIIYSELANNLLKEDIYNRFKEYYNSNLFQTFKKDGININTAEFTGYAPYFALAQIFSNTNTLMSLVESPTEELYNQFYKEGWINLVNFLDTIPDSNNESEYEELFYSIKLIKKYIENGLAPLNASQYNQIWSHF